MILMVFLKECTLGENLFLGQRELPIEISRQGEAIQAYRHFAKSFPYSASSIKHAYERRRCKLKSSEKANFKEHENRSLTECQEGMHLVYILLCSEKSLATQASSLHSFSKSLLGFPLSLQTIQ